MIPMKTQIAPRSGSGGYALVMVMLVTAMALLVLSASMNWTSQTALLNERNNQLSTSLFAAEAATEKVLTRMSRDYEVSGEGTVYGNLSQYQALYPTTNESSYWANFQFSNAQGGSGQTYVQRTATQSYVQLESVYSGLSGFATTYKIISNARQTNGRFNLTNAVQQEVQLASIPVFQFAIFYNSLLEFTWAAPFTVRGRVHANNNIYTGSSQPLTFSADVTATGSIQKRTWGGYNVSAMTGSINYQAQKETNVTSLTLPIGTNNTAAAVREVINQPPAGESSSSAIGQQRYYNKAELQILVSNSTVTIKVQQPFDTSPVTINWTNANYFITTNLSYTDQREGKTTRTTEIDVGKLITWSGTNSQVIGKLGSGNPPNILYVADNRTVTSSQIAVVRLVNGQVLPSRGLTVATPNPLYVKGHYNVPNAYLGTTNTSSSKPASLVSDALTILSPNWNDANSASSFTSRPSVDTTVNSAILTGDVDSAGANGDTPFSGGVMNLTRLLEDWGNGARRLTLNGSIVNLFNSVRATAPWQTPGTYYYAPTRDFNFDNNFLDSTKQPPGTPALRTLIRSKWLNPMANVINYGG